MSLNKDLIDMLACPKCKNNLKEKEMFLNCKYCKLAYPILEKDVPNMLIEEAWELRKAKKFNFKHNIKI